MKALETLRILKTNIDDGSCEAGPYAREMVDTAIAELEIEAAPLTVIRLTNLLGEIVQQATDNPAKLTAFNSPLLSKACIELWNHNNPDAPVDERTSQIYDQMAKVGYNV